MKIQIRKGEVTKGKITVNMIDLKKTIQERNRIIAERGMMKLEDRKKKVPSINMFKNLSGAKKKQIRLKTKVQPKSIHKN